MILAIESASTDPSLALATPDGAPLAADAWTSDRRQGAELMPRLLALLASTGRGLDDLTAVAVGIGPGSFTGLRVAMALGKGLAFGLGLPIVGVQSLTAWLASEPDAAAAVARAGAHEVYVRRRGVDEVTVVDREALARELAAEPVVAPEEVAAHFGLFASRTPWNAASAIARAAAEQLATRPEGDDLARLEPAYLRAPRGIGPMQGEMAPWR